MNPYGPLYSGTQPSINALPCHGASMQHATAVQAVRVYFYNTQVGACIRVRQQTPSSPTCVSPAGLLRGKDAAIFSFIRHVFPHGEK